jgi:membrane-associated protease RseP (regulator of RpoE activity)
MSDDAPPTSSPAGLFPQVQVFVARPRRRRIWLYILFFLLTVLTTLVVGARMELNYRQNVPALSLNDDSISFFPIVWALKNPSHLLLGIPFSATLMLILFAHEMGHYLYCRHYGVNATMPFFVPFPSLFGTMGAFIRIKSPIRSRAALFDIGVAGPIAGFVLACLALVIGLLLSKPAPAFAPTPDLQLGYPLIFHLTHGLLRMSAPLPSLYLNPIGIAAWVGMFATALNLLPGGQLDGGHIVFSMSPRLHRITSLASILILMPLAFYRWTGWLLWAVLLGITGMRHPMVPSQPGMGGRRRWLALFAAVMLLLTFTPAPFLHTAGRDVLPDIRDLFHQLWLFVAKIATRRA